MIIILYQAGRPGLYKRQYDLHLAFIRPKLVRVVSFLVSYILLIVCSCDLETLFAIL